MENPHPVPDEDTFWTVLLVLGSSTDRPASPEGERAFVDQLVKLGPQAIQSFNGQLAKKLFDLDGPPVFARVSGLTGKTHPSPESFLHFRCAVVAAGAEVYATVLRDPSASALYQWDLAAGAPLLGLVDEAHRAASGVPVPKPGHNVAMGSNRMVWGSPFWLGLPSVDPAETRWLDVGLGIDWTATYPGGVAPFFAVRPLGAPGLKHRVLIAAQRTATLLARDQDLRRTFAEAGANTVELVLTLVSPGGPADETPEFRKHPRKKLWISVERAVPEPVPDDLDVWAQTGILELLEEARTWLASR